MLRSTRKEVCERLHDTLIESAWDDMQEINSIDLGFFKKEEQWGMVALAIWNAFHEQYYFGYRNRMNKQECFREWCAGLPNYIPPFYYNWDCKEYVKGLLEETDEEAKRFTEREAEDYMANLFYREVYKEVNK